MPVAQEPEDWPELDDSPYASWSRWQKLLVIAAWFAFWVILAVFKVHGSSSH
jgi:hypothetical protein